MSETLSQRDGSGTFVCPKCGGETLQVGECFTCSAPRRLNGHGPSSSFPIDTFPRAMRDLAESWAANFPCPVEWIALPMLVVAASAIGNSRVVRLNDSWREWARLWGAVIAEPGSGKSPSARMALTPVHRRANKLMAAHQEALERWEREGEKGRAPLEPEIWTTDVTIEALKQGLPRAPRGILCSQDELSGWVSGMNQYKAKGAGSDLQKWLELWSGEPFFVKRVKSARAIYAPDPIVNLIGGVVTENIPVIVTSSADGFSDRFLFAHAEGGAYRRRGPGVPEVIVAAWCGLYEELVLLQPAFPEEQPRPVDMIMRGDFDSWEEAHMREADPDAPHEFDKGTYAKLTSYCGRLSLVLACCHGHRHVEKADFDGAVELIGYFKEQVLALKDATRTRFRSDARTEILSFDPLVRYLKRKGERTVRDIVAARVPHCRNAGVTQQILDEARNAGLVIQIGATWQTTK